jgi:dihydroorotate dehydrogenase
MLYDLLRPAIFRLSADDPERAHEWAMCLLASTNHRSLAATTRALGMLIEDPRLRQDVFGLTFPNPVGVAGGFDKNAVALHALAALGFGFVEAGTVTYHPQSGNPRPRIVRLVEQQALINRMGFNNEGAERIAQRLRRTGQLTIPLGISLGKSRVTPLDEAVADYRASFRLLAPYADYIAVNVSSPNTPGLRALQERDQIETLLATLQGEAQTLSKRIGRSLPILVKVAPDLSDAALAELLDVCLARRVDGVIAVNTTVQGVAAGGLSGRPLFPRAIEVVRRIGAATEGRLPIIGVGGIFSPADAYAMLKAGAALVQVYTGLIYEGPAIAARINRGLLRLMARDGVRALSELRDADRRQQPFTVSRGTA